MISSPAIRRASTSPPLPPAPPRPPEKYRNEDSLKCDSWPHTSMSPPMRATARRVPAIGRATGAAAMMTGEGAGGGAVQRSTRRGPRRGPPDLVPPPVPI